MQRPRAVVFDMDGLMFNTEDVYFLVGSELLRRRGCEFTRELSDAMMGRPPRPGFEVMIAWHGLTDSWEILADESREVYLELVDQHIQPMPGLMELLDDLEQARIPKAVCTSSARVVVERSLAHFNLQPRFRFVLTAEDIVHGKPDPEIYLKAAGLLAVEPGEMLVLEDSQTGCQAAAAAGALTVAVPGEHSRNQDFRVASLVIDRLDDPRLRKLLEL